MTAPELHRPFAVDRIGANGTMVTVTADAAECAALAERLLLPAVAAVECRWQLRGGPGGAIEAEGALLATVTQTCIVSLDPFESVVQEKFAVRFVLTDRESEEADDPDAPDELIYDGATLDLGEATAEQLALALDPYPRKPGAELEDFSDDEPEGAFAQLSRLRPS